MILAFNQRIRPTDPIVGTFERPSVPAPPTPYLGLRKAHHIDREPLSRCGAISAMRSESGVPANASRYSWCSTSLALDAFLHYLHMGSIAGGLVHEDWSFHSSAPKCSQAIAILALATMSGRSVIHSDSSRWWPLKWPVYSAMVSRIGLGTAISRRELSRNRQITPFSSMIVGPSPENDLLCVYMRIVSFVSAVPSRCPRTVCVGAK
ncbi:hypothetical protein B0H14DRAFT_2796175 [Mycena olivaceomarginata]|nr:hypothetical protein B0H14DRAFT_2796175 [Mycena olivaceomarginata]